MDVPIPNANLRRLLGQPEPFLAQPQSILGLLPFGQIGDEIDAQRSVFSLDMTQGDGDGKLCTILAPAFHIEARSRGPVVGRGKVPGAVLGLGLRRPRGKQNLQRQLQQLSATVAEHLYGPEIGHHDSAIGCH